MTTRIKLYKTTESGQWISLEIEPEEWEEMSIARRKQRVLGFLGW